MTSEVLGPEDIQRAGQQIPRDAELDAVNTDDRTYLRELGYRQELRRGLGLFSSFAIQFSSIAVIAGVALAMNAGLTRIGPAMLLAWLLGGAFQMVTAMGIAEGVSAYPLAGGAYQIINRIIGGRAGLGWIVGWLLLMAHISAVALDAVGISPFITSWFGIELTTHGEILLWATGLIVLSTLANLFAVKIAAAFNNTVGVIAEVIAATIVIVGIIIAMIISNHDFHSISFIGSDAGILQPGQGTLWPFLFALLVPVFVISGFDINGTAGEETESASRTVPRGMLIASFGTFALGSVMLLLVLLSIQDLDATTGAANPIKLILDDILGSVPGQLFQIMVVISVFVNMMVMQLTAGRIIWSQARDGQLPFPRALVRLSGDGVPITAVLVAAGIAFLMVVWTGLLNVLIAMAAVLWAAAYSILVAVLMYARRRGTLPQRPFDLGRWWPLVDGVAFVWSAALCVILVKTDPTKVGYGLAGAVAIGAVAYLATVPRKRRGILRDVRSAEEIVESSGA